jgi:hypothetical protein
VVAVDCAILQALGDEVLVPKCPAAQEALARVGAGAHTVHLRVFDLRIERRDQRPELNVSLAHKVTRPPVVDLEMQPADPLAQERQP